MSPKTVEANLTRVYRKLGVRSRTELANHANATGSTQKGAYPTTRSRALDVHGTAIFGLEPGDSARASPVTRRALQSTARGGRRAAAHRLLLFAPVQRQARRAHPVKPPGPWSNLSSVTE